VDVADIAGRYSVVELLEARMGVAHGRLPQVTWFSGLVEVLNQVTIIAMMLAAAAMVREREHGTMEHLLASPLRTWEMFTAKVVPVVVLVPLAALVGIVHGVFATTWTSATRSSSRGTGSPTSGRTWWGSWRWGCCCSWSPSGASRGSRADPAVARRPGAG
jgi:hypothetical protein